MAGALLPAMRSARLLSAMRLRWPGSVLRATCQAPTIAEPVP
jgi:hypothetical protein